MIPDAYWIAATFPSTANGLKIYIPESDNEYMAQNRDDTGATKTIGPNKDFDPIGTLTLIGIYFVILLLSWVYIYYIEFLGRDLVVVG